MRKYKWGRVVATAVALTATMNVAFAADKPEKDKSDKDKSAKSTKDAKDAKDAKDSESPAEVDKLRAQVKEQRDLIIHMLQMEQQRNDLLLKILKENPNASLPPGALSALTSGRSAATAAAGESGGAAPTSSSGGTASSSKKGSAAAAAARAIALAARNGSITGKIAVDRGGLEGVYVYVRNIKRPLARGNRIEIVQKDRRFVPEVAVVPRGTVVTFPNADAIFHNVFSPSPTHPFDLGAYRAGDPPKSEVLTDSGVVDVYCNMHVKMHASILVVPNQFYARVGGDGTFRLEGVPVGRRELVAWSPHTTPATVTIDLLPDTPAVANFQLKSLPPQAHNNKLGQAYPSYEP